MTLVLCKDIFYSFTHIFPQCLKYSLKQMMNILLRMMILNNDEVTSKIFFKKKIKKRCASNNEKKVISVFVMFTQGLR